MVRKIASGIRRCCQLQLCARRPHQPPAGPAAEDCREEAVCGLAGPTRCPPSGCLSGLLLGCPGPLKVRLGGPVSLPGDLPTLWGRCGRSLLAHTTTPIQGQPLSRKPPSPPAATFLRTSFRAGRLQVPSPARLCLS